jgi:homoserine kinase
MSTLSGSGSTFFSMVYDEDAPKLQELFSIQYPDYRVMTLDFDNYGIITER